MFGLANSDQVTVDLRLMCDLAIRALVTVAPQASPGLRADIDELIPLLMHYRDMTEGAILAELGGLMAGAATGPTPLDRALDLVAEDVKRFEETLLRTLEPQRPYLSDTEYAIYGRGKKLRPLLLLLAARLTDPGQGAEPLPQRAIGAAVSLEMLHVATLIHDDIIDVAPRRRGGASVNQARGSDIALLVGDLQFVQAVRCFAAGIETKEDIALVQTVLDVGFKICCGEIDELTTDATWSATRLRARYFRTIDRKTAVLFQLACESGASLRARKRAIWKIGRYGRLVGRAFQMMDDLGDFLQTDEDAGKNRGTDLRRRRATLPIIYALAELPREHLVHRIMRGETAADADFDRAIEAVIGCDGFIRSYGEARGAVVEAVECLNQFPASPYRDVLADIAYYVVDRGAAALDPGPGAIGLASNARISDKM